MAEPRLTLLEMALVDQTDYVGTPFATILAASNPGRSEITTYPSVQYFFESYRTTERGAVAGYITEQQEVLFGALINSSYSIESDARRETYLLAEELEDRIIGFMPDLGETIQILFPIYDVDAAFTQMEATGLYGLTVYYMLKWQLSKGAKIQ